MNHKLKNLKNFVNFLFARKRVSYTVKFNIFKEGFKMTFATFQKHIFTDYCESCDKKCDKIRTSAFKHMQSP